MIILKVSVSIKIITIMRYSILFLSLTCYGLNAPPAGHLLVSLHGVREIRFLVMKLIKCTEIE